jgi:hypothetical protein
MAPILTKRAFISLAVIAMLSLACIIALKTRSRAFGSLVTVPGGRCGDAEWADETYLQHLTERTMEQVASVRQKTFRYVSDWRAVAPERIVYRPNPNRANLRLEVFSHSRSCFYSVTITRDDNTGTTNVEWFVNKNP